MRIIKKCKANETKEKNAEKELNYSRGGAAAIRGCAKCKKNEKKDRRRALGLAGPVY